MHERILSWVTYFNISLNYWVTILYIWSWALRIPVSCSHHIKMHSFLSGDLTLTRYLFPFHPVGSPSHAGWAHQDFLSYSPSVHFPEQMNSVPVLTIFKVSKWRQATLYNGDKLTRHRAQGSGQLEKLESPLRQNNPITLHNLILNHLLNDTYTYQYITLNSVLAFKCFFSSSRALFLYSSLGLQKQAHFTIRNIKPAIKIILIRIELRFQFYPPHRIAKEGELKHQT